MTRFLVSNFLWAAMLAGGVVFTSPHALAQNESVLAQIYGQGVHAYYDHRYDDAYQYLSSAIDAGTKDPRAYYFRGIVSYEQGRVYEAESDWAEGARLEATTGGGAPVGRSLSRFQGSARLKLEQIRRQARLEAMKTAAQRSDQRLQQLGVDPNAGNAANQPAVGATPPPAAPSAPGAADPFAEDAAMAAGQPKVQADDALEGADENPFADDPQPAAGAAAADAGGMDDGNANPFGTPAPAADAGNDPFGGSDAGNDPFGAPAGDSDPFGAPAGGGNDPFGGDPFGN